ncbi:MAG: NADPH-dependent curcumin reductase CurA, partial [Psychromonas sp.]
MATFTAINLIKRPAGGPIDSSSFAVVKKTIPTVGTGKFLVKQQHMSLDPAMFGWM